jgi:hypothetical protein
VIEGKNLSEVVNDLVKRIQSKAIDKLFDLLLFGGSGSSASGGIFGSLFGGFRAEGGPVRRGAPYVVGERGPELFVPGASGQIIPNAPRAPSMPAIGRSNQVNR